MFHFILEFRKDYTQEFRPQDSEPIPKHGEVSTEFVLDSRNSRDFDGVWHTIALMRRASLPFPLAALALFGSACLSLPLQASPASAKGAPPPLNCANPPAINPSLDFLGNFNNKCYLIPMVAGHGGSSGGDLGAEYDQIFYLVQPGYELVIYDQFPSARFLSVTVYDQHAVNTSELLDVNILPQNSTMTNPFQIGVPYQPNQFYGVSVSLGGGVPTTPAAGCSTADTTIDQNLLDASQIHSGLTWTGWPDLPANFPPHLTGANSAGSLMVRKYAIMSDTGVAGVFVRQLSDGCAITAAAAAAQGIVTTNSATGEAQEDTLQIDTHEVFAGEVQPRYCWPRDPTNEVQWVRTQNYVPEINSNAAYLRAPIGADTVQKMISEGGFMQIQFPLPTFPDMPCPTGDCWITGNEQLRYYSMSFEDDEQNVYATIHDTDFVQDPNGNVTLVVGFGTQPPAWVTAANYYTYLDLSQLPNYQNLNQVDIRNILPNSSFNCSAFQIPFNTTEFNNVGGYMGAYVPTVSFVGPSKLPTIPVPPVRVDSCGVKPTVAPTVCGH